MSVIKTTTIKAPVEKVWEALTEKEQMKQWYFTIPDLVLEEGSQFSFYEPGGQNKFLHTCVITEVTPLQRFQHTWTHPTHSQGRSLVTWDLVPQGNATEVTLMHEGIENFADGGPDLSPENYAAGWEEIVERSLKNFVEQQEG